MDPFFNTRIAMAGWIFIAAILGSIWHSQSSQWTALVEIIKSGNGTIAMAVLGALVGVGAPPAIGFLLERVTSVVLLLFKRNLWAYPCAKDFGKAFAKEAAMVQPEFQCPKSESGLFHIFFYTYADQKLLDWARRRRTHMYASLTSALSIIFALLFTKFFFNAFSWSIGIASSIVVGFLLFHASREIKYHQEVISAWVGTLGVKASKKFASKMLQPGERLTPTQSMEAATNNGMQRTPNMDALHQQRPVRTAGAAR